MHSEFDADHLRDPRHIWEERYARHIDFRYEPWLEPWRSLVESGQPDPVLDLGCGGGHDVYYLSRIGCGVIAVDYSQQALLITRQKVGQATIAQADLRQGLLFPTGLFGGIVANLSLHYFRWSETERIVAEVRRCLKPGRYLFARVNSTNDRHYGAVGHKSIEDNLYLVRGMLKRFFDRPDIDRLFGQGWIAHGIAEKIIHRYGNPKVVWELVFQKKDGV